MKEFDMAKFMEDFKIIPISTVCSFDYWEDQLDILNNLILLCKEEHASLKRIKFTQTSTPWMENKGIVALQRERDQLRYKAHLRKTEENWNSYRQIRNKI